MQSLKSAWSSQRLKIAQLVITLGLAVLFLALLLYGLQSETSAGTRNLELAIAPYSSDLDAVIMLHSKARLAPTLSEMSTKAALGATGTGAVSGTITVTATGTPIAGAEVQVYRVQAAGLSLITSTVTTADGTYLAQGLDDDDYVVHVRANGYAGGWYPDAVYCHLDAATVIVRDGRTTGPIDLALGAGGVITGYVHAEDGTTPIEGATISDSLVDEARNCARIGTSTDATGAYTLASVLPGRYYLSTRASGYAHEFYEDGTQFSNATVVTATAGVTTTDISFTLDRGGVVTGHVYAQDGATPLDGAQVVALLLHPDDMVVQGGAAFTATISDGSYRLEHLPFGDRYAILSYYTSPPFPGWQYYPLSPDLSRATPVTMTKTYTPTGIDFVLGPTGAISGHVYAADGVTPLPHSANLFATNFFTSAIYLGSTAEGGLYQTSGFLPTDDYLVAAYSPGYVSKYYDGAAARANATPVSVTAPHVTPDVDFVLEAYVPLDVGSRWTYRWSNSTTAVLITETVDLVSQNGNQYTLIVDSPYADGQAHITRQDNGVHWSGWSITGQGGAPEWRSVIEYAFVPTRFFYFQPTILGEVWRPFGARWVQQGEEVSSHFAQSTISTSPVSIIVPAGSFDDAIQINTAITSTDDYLAGTREMWFAPDTGLVRVVYHHNDGSTTTAELVSLSVLDQRVYLPLVLKTYTQ